MQERDAIDRVIEALEPLAAKIGDTAAHVYEVLVREAILTGFTNIATAIVAGLLSWVLFLRGRVYWEKYEEMKAARYAPYYKDGEGWAFNSGVTYFLAVAGSLIALAYLKSAIHYLANPEFRAIDHLLKVIQ